MAKVGLWLGLAFGVGFVSPGVASGMANEALVGPEMVETFKCIACHRVDDKQGRKRLGPDFNVIAERYAGEGGVAVVDYLATRIRHGARGSWGAVPMPAQSHVSDADAKALVQWILSLADVERRVKK